MTIERTPEDVTRFHFDMKRLEQHERDQATIRALTEALETIASFAPGNGDVCEIIAKRARAALAQAKQAQQ